MDKRSASSISPAPPARRGLSTPHFFPGMRSPTAAHVLLLLAALPGFAAGSLFSHPTATLPSGQSVKGKFRDDKNTAVFHAVPYAQPPLGDLRFAPPSPLPASDAEIDATSIKRKSRPRCL
jgi:hypothetical protein